MTSFSSDLTPASAPQAIAAATLPPAPAVNSEWDLVRPATEGLVLAQQMKAGDLELGDVFSTRGTHWLHCGWYSAVYHVLGLSTEGGRQVISCHEPVERNRQATSEETEALRANILKSAEGK